MADSSFLILKKNIKKIYSLVETDQLRQALDGFQETPLEFESIAVIRELNQLEREKQLNALDKRFYLTQKKKLRARILILAERLEKKFEEAHLWEKAKVKESLKNYLSYLKEFPQGEYAEEALWKVAQLENSYESYDKYLRQFPEGRYWEEAYEFLDGGNVKKETSSASRKKGWRPQITFDLYMLGGILVGCGLLVVLLRYVIFPDYFYDPVREEKFISLAIESHLVEVGGNIYISQGSDGDAYGESTALSPFKISRYEVTQGLWEHIMGNNPSAYSNCPDCPVEQVSWYDAILFCNKLSLSEDRQPYYILDTLQQDTDNIDVLDTLKWVVNIQPDADGYRLPTEAEWSYIFERGGSYIPPLEATSEDEKAGTLLPPRTQPVYREEPDSLGICGLQGNVSEWCWDWYQALQEKRRTVERIFPQKNPLGPNSGRKHVVRGQNFSMEDSLSLRRDRLSAPSISSQKTIGFRVARNIPPYIEMIGIEGGTFLMGNSIRGGRDNEKPSHSVEVGSFELGKYEITQKQWAAVMGADSVSSCPACPAFNISWYEAVQFCNQLSELHGYQPYYQIDSKPHETRFLSDDEKGDWQISWDSTADGYRLPTEAEWEFAAKGGIRSNRHPFAGGANIGEVAWFNENILTAGGELALGGQPDINEVGPQPVGLKNPNELNLFDMTGNVWEWCQDTFAYYKRPYFRRTQRETRVLRGGGYLSSPYFSRLPIRMGREPHRQSKAWGFRVARSITYLP